MPVQYLLCFIGCTITIIANTSIIIIMNSNADNTNSISISVVFNLFICSVPANTAIDLAVALVARCFTHFLRKQHNLVIAF